MLYLSNISLWVIIKKNDFRIIKTLSTCRNKGKFMGRIWKMVLKIIKKKKKKAHSCFISIFIQFICLYLSPKTFLETIFCTTVLKNNCSLMCSPFFLFFSLVAFSSLSMLCLLCFPSSHLFSPSVSVRPSILPS